MKKRILTPLILCLCTVLCHAYRQKATIVYSPCMNKNINVTVITPETYRCSMSYPVIYLLHGYGGDHTVWTKDSIVGRLADQYNIIVVMPDASVDSWYFDCPNDPEYRYETFVAQELVSHVDSAYSTIRDRRGRAITGLSMGGHGSFYLGIRHQEIFGNMGSISGGLDIRPFHKNWNIADRLGSYEEHPDIWDRHTVINMTHLLKSGKMNIIFDCGTEDFFYDVNCSMHKKLLSEEIPHEFHTRPGSHNWSYWYNAIKYQFLFFSDMFKPDIAM